MVAGFPHVEMFQYLFDDILNTFGFVLKIKRLWSFTYFPVTLKINLCYKIIDKALIKNAHMEG